MSAVKQFGSALFGEQRISYRRMLAFIVGTALLVYGFIGSSEWLNLTMVFIAAEALPRTVQAAGSAFSRQQALPARAMASGNSAGALDPEGK